MKRLRIGLAVVCLTLAAAAAGWLALRGSPSSKRGDVPSAAPAASDVGPAPELAEPAGLAPPEAEGEPAPAERVEVGARVGAEAAVTVLDARGAPVAGAQWALFRGADVLASGTTEADGVATCALDGAPADLAVAPPAHPPEVFALEPGLERQVATLTAGAAVAGVVLVNGSPPREPLKLELNVEQVLFAQDALPAPVWQALGRRARAVQSLATATGANGAFRFDGLPAVLAGELTWPRPFTAETGGGTTGRALAVESPVEDWVVRLVSPPEIAGRVVRPGTGEPIPEAHVTLAWDDAGEAKELRKRAGQDGGFVFPLRGALPPRIRLTVSEGAFIGSQLYEREVPPGAVSYDAGALAIRATRAQVFAVRDAAGAPIQGATLWELPPRPEGRHEAQTDAEGRGELQVSLDARALRCGALGYGTVEAPLPPGGEPLAITLPQGTVLEVRLGEGASDAGLRLRGPEPPFDGDGRPSWSPIPPLHLASYEPRPDGSVATTYRGAPDGIYLLNGVRPGVALGLEVLDAHGSVLLEESVPPLAAGERRVVALAVSAQAGVLSGRVLSADGAPVKGALVIVGPVGGIPGEFMIMFGGSPSPEEDGAPRTDADGRFRIEGLAADTVRLVVTHPRHAPLLVAEQPVVEGLELELGHGRFVRVAVHGPEGQRVPGASAFLAVGYPPWASCGPPKLGDDFVWNHAPCGEVTAVAFAGGRAFERPLGPGCEDEEVDVETPAWQTVTVQLTGAPAEQGMFVVLGGRDQPRQQEVGAGTEVRFDVVFPGRYEARVWGWSNGSEVEKSASVALEVTAEAPASVTVELGP